MNNTNYFLLRRLHSLLGVFPLGVFLFNHLLTNSSAIVSAQFFEEKVALIHMLGPLLPLVEAGFIFIPLALHIAIGVYIALTGKIEVGSNIPYGRNWAYAFQRWTGWAALAFIVYHVVHLRFLHKPHMYDIPFSVELGEMFTQTPLAFIYVPAYLIGGLAVIFHFANGLCTFCMTWGITVGPLSQRIMVWVALAIGAVLTLLLLTAMFAFIQIGLDPAFGTEEFIQPLRDVHRSY